MQAGQFAGVLSSDLNDSHGRAFAMKKNKRHFAPIYILFTLFFAPASGLADPFRSSFEVGEDACPTEQPADDCGICGGDSSACVCAEFEAVGYPADGLTCNLFGDTVWPDGEPELPGAAIDEYTYNEFFTGEGHDLPFEKSGGVFLEAIEPGDGAMGSVGKANACGACLLITGVNGSRVFFVREIADVAAVGANGIPRNVHLDNSAINDVRNGSGVAVDVTVQPVPCPFTGTIQLKHRIFLYDQAYYWRGMEYTPFQSIYPIKTLEIRAETGHDQWYELPKNWLNEYQIGANFANDDENGWAGVNIPVPDPPNGPVRFRLTSVYNQVLITPPIQQVERPGDSATGLVFYDLGVQFQPRPHTLGACEVTTVCGNKQLDEGEACEPALDSGCNPSSCEFYP
jgi:expansin (peptidoglycan-binding protein)